MFITLNLLGPVLEMRSGDRIKAASYSPDAFSLLEVNGEKDKL